MINEEMIIVNGLKVFTETLGVDIGNVYSKATHSKFYLPNFLQIYEEYKIQIMNKNAKRSMEHYNKIQAHLKALGQDLDWNQMTNDEYKEIDTRNEAELYDYLLDNHFSFKMGESKIYNHPAKGVW